MNGIHDMGGMHGMGPIEPEKDEPVFHEPWEGRVFALNLAARSGRGNIDHGRHEIELLPPAEYLRMSYYEKWLARLENVLIKLGVISREELATGKPAAGSVKAIPALSAAVVAGTLGRGRPARRDVPAAARFQVNEQVRARNLHPEGHTRLPRYARGKKGTIARDHGVFVFPHNQCAIGGRKPAARLFGPFYRA